MNEVEKLKRQLFIERCIFCGIIVAALITWLYIVNSHSKYAVNVDGKTVVCVSKEEIALDIIDKTKAQSGLAVNEVDFKETVEVKKAAKNTALTNTKDAHKLFRDAVTLKTQKWAVLSNGDPVVAFDKQSQAADFLNQSKMKYAVFVKHLAEEPQFKETVTVENIGVDPQIFKKTVKDALEYVFSGGVAVSSADVYIVKKGDLAGRIAEREGVTISDLKKMNPGVNLNRLSIGDTIKLRPTAGKSQKEKPTLTVIVRDQNEKIERIAPEIIRVSSAQMYVGKTYLISPGKAGKRRIKTQTIYENGIKKSSEIVEEEILVKPKPRQIAEGIKTR